MQLFSKWLGGAAIVALVSVAAFAQTVGPNPSPGGVPSGAAGGDLTGTYPNPKIKVSVSLTTPVLGVATATTINGNIFTAGTYTLTGAAAKTLAFNNSLTLAGTDNTTITFPTTSATIARTDASNTFTGHQTIEGVTSTGATGTGNLVFSTAPTFTILTANDTSVNTISSFASTNASASLLSGATTQFIIANAGGTAFGITGWPNATILESSGTGGLVLDTYGSPTAPIQFQINRTNVGQVTSTGLNSLAIGATTKSTGAFTTLAATSTVTFSGLASDTALTDRTVCQVTATSVLAFGSGTLGICLGTSSARYKNGIAPLALGLPEILALKPKSFYLDKQHGDPKKLMYGFLAEDMVNPLPKLVGRDKSGRPDTADYLGIVPVLVKAVQQEQHEIDALQLKNASLEKRIIRLESIRK
jgi:hypothetical protein